MTYGVVRAFQVIVNTLLCSPEKAGVGGSTPSLATIILKDLAKDYVFLPVRSQSVFAEGDETGRCTQMISSNLVRTLFFLSPLSVRFGLSRG